MDKEYLQGVYDYFNEQYKEYHSATQKAQKSIVEKEVRQYSHRLNEELYLALNENSASGLFEHGFFESDLSRSLSILKEILR